MMIGYATVDSSLKYLKAYPQILRKIQDGEFEDMCLQGYMI